MHPLLQDVIQSIPTDISPTFYFLQDEFEVELISFDSFVIPYTETYDKDNQYHPLLCHTASALICLFKCVRNFVLIKNEFSIWD